MRRRLVPVPMPVRTAGSGTETNREPRRRIVTETRCSLPHVMTLRWIGTLLVLLSGLSSSFGATRAPICDATWLAGASGSDVQMRVREGDDPNETCNPDEDRPLHRALAGPVAPPEVVRALLSAGADVLIPNRFGKTAWERSEERYLEALLHERDEQAARRMYAVRDVIRKRGLDAFGNPVLGRPLADLNPCLLVMHGRHFGKLTTGPDLHYGILAGLPDPPDLPLSHGSLPLEFELHHSVPPRYRSVFEAAAAEWNTKAGLELIAIRGEIDRRDVSHRWGQDSRNVVYWEGVSATEPLAAYQTAGATAIKSAAASPHEERLLVTEVDVTMYDVSTSTSLDLAREMLARSLRRAGVEDPAEDIGDEGLQARWLGRLSSMSDKELHAWVVQLMHDKGVRLPIPSSGADREEWIVAAMNARMEHVERLTSFEDLRAWLVAGFSIDLDTLDDSATLLKDYVLHEFGHALGLRHNPDPDSLMHGGLHITPVPATPRNYPAPTGVDDAALHGLTCTYDVGAFPAPAE